MKLYAKRILFFTLAMTFLLAACNPAVTTPDAAEIQHQVETAVALTVASQNLETQQAAPAVTETPLPTQTEVVAASPTPILPTATPFVIVPPTTVPGGGGVTVVKPDYACDSIRRRPFDNTVFKPGDTFDIKWIIVNTGTKTMRAGLDLKYSAGTLLANVDRVELPELKPGAQYAVDFDAVAPDKEGTYTMTFIVEGGLCYPATLIKVER